MGLPSDAGLLMSFDLVLWAKTSHRRVFTRAFRGQNIPSVWGVRLTPSLPSGVCWELWWWDKTLSNGHRGNVDPGSLAARATGSQTGQRLGGRLLGLWVLTTPRPADSLVSECLGQTELLRLTRQVTSLPSFQARPGAVLLFLSSVGIEVWAA